MRRLCSSQGRAWLNLSLLLLRTWWFLAKSRTSRLFRPCGSTSHISPRLTDSLGFSNKKDLGFCCLYRGRYYLDSRIAWTCYANTQFSRNDCCKGSWTFQDYSRSQPVLGYHFAPRQSWSYRALWSFPASKRQERDAAWFRFTFQCYTWRLQDSSIFMHRCTNQTQISTWQTKYISACSDRDPLGFLPIDVEDSLEFILGTRWRVGKIYGEIVLLAVSDACSWIFPWHFLPSIGANGTTAWVNGYLARIVWKRGDLEKEKVCFEPDLLVGDWLIWLKLAIESRQYLSFIKIIYKGKGIVHR